MGNVGDPNTTVQIKNNLALILKWNVDIQSKVAIRQVDYAIIPHILCLIWFEFDLDNGMHFQN